MDRRTFVGLTAATTASSLLARTVFAQTAPKAKNVVLVHGLFADGSSWSEVIPRLQAAGLNVTSVQNPLTTLPEAVDTALRVLGRQNGPTVLAGHSFSGMIVTEAGVHPNVSALVYLAARAPDAGEDYTDLAKLLIFITKSIPTQNDQNNHLLNFPSPAGFSRHCIRWR